MFVLRPELREAAFCSVLVISACGLLLFRFGAPRRAAAVLLGVLLLDQLSQCLAALHFRHPEGLAKGAQFLGGWMLFSYVENWHLGFGRTDQDLLLLALLLVLCLLALYRRMASYQCRMALLTEIACALLVGGLLGSLIDRVRMGYVVDFISFFRVSVTCNLADLSALLAGLLLGIRAAVLLYEGLAGPALPPPAPRIVRPSELSTVSAMLAGTTLVLSVIWTMWPI